MNGGQKHEHEFLQELRHSETSTWLHAGDHCREMWGLPPGHCKMGGRRFPKVLEWMGNGELLTQNNLFPPPAYDYGYDLLISRDDLFKDSEYSIARYV